MMTRASNRRAVILGTVLIAWAPLHPRRIKIDKGSRRRPRSLLNQRSPHLSRV